MSFNDLVDEVRKWFGTPEEAASAAHPVDRPLTPEGGAALCFIVDDEPGIRRFISGALQGHGAAIQEFSNAAEALAAASARPPQLIFLDVTLEHSDAIEVMRGLANIGYRGVIQLMSGRDSALLDNVRQVGERYALRMMPVLQKPFRAEMVRRAAQDNLPVQAATLKVDLDEALKRGWMRVWYQPKIDLQKKVMVGIEALARVDHPTHGILLPGAFIVGASDASLDRLTEFALESALTDWTSFAEAGFTFRPSINVTVHALLNVPIIELARKYWPKNSAMNGLILEVTEDQIVHDIAMAHEIATQLKIHNIEIAIDDFGKGYSSLARLKALPFCELKLDMSFVKNCSINADNAAICETTIELAHRFGSLAVAEGIESPEDLRTLHRMGCDIGQGFLLAAPMSRDRLLSLLQQRRTAPSKVVPFPGGQAAKSA